MNPLADAPLDPSREQARGWAVDELSRREYQQARPGIVERLASWLEDRLRDLVGSLEGIDSPGSAIGAAVVLAIVLGLIWFAVWRFGGPGSSGTRRHPESVFSDAVVVSADEHRAAARRAERDGDWRQAVLEHFRALVRELEETTVLAPRPGRTADEAAAEAALVVPEQAESLTTASRTFDEIRYGGRTATREDAAQVGGTEGEVSRAVRSGRAVLS